MAPLKLVSWNVNGLRACMGKGFSQFLEEEAPDVICLQETKMQKEQADFDFPGYFEYWNSATARKGYSGTALFSRKEPRSVAYGLGMEEFDGEGRVITAAYEDFTLVTVYTPNAQRDLARIQYRMAFEDAFRAHLQKLREQGHVVVCGDMNVAHRPIDLKNPKANTGNAGFSFEERGQVYGAFGHRHGGHLPALLPGKGGGLLLVELPLQLPAEQHRVAHRLLPLRRGAAAPGGGQPHPPAGAGQRPLPGGTSLERRRVPMTELEQWVKESQRAVFLGGAGVSTASGIPDFRSAHGLYRQEKAGLSYEEMLSHGYFARHTEEFFRFYREVMLYPQAKPNAAHYALARLEGAGKLRAVITQNIDGLHQLAGSKNVLELHGSELRNRCQTLDRVLPRHGGGPPKRGRAPVPLRRRCQAGSGPLRGEPGPGPLGTGHTVCPGGGPAAGGGHLLVVYPVAGLVEYLGPGGKLAILNRDPTPYDGRADLVLRGDLAQELESLAAAFS